MIIGNRLNKWSAPEENGVVSILEKGKMVQLDPLNPAGRYHDIYFMARVPRYTQGLFEKISYSELRIFEHHFPVLYAISSDCYPLFHPSIYKKRLSKWAKERQNKFLKAQPDGFDKILEHIKKHGPSRPNDLNLGPRQSPKESWQSGKLSTLGFDLLWTIGELCVVRRDSLFRKYYDLPIQHIPKKYLIPLELSKIDIEFQRFQLRHAHLPVSSVGKISSTFPFFKKKGFSPNWLNQDSENVPHLVRLEKTDSGFLVPSTWQSMLEDSIDTHMRVIGPLDPLIHDRKLTNLVFDFEYTWDVYKPRTQRRWGYYVYPLLYREQLVGRLEANLDKKESILTLKNMNLEDNSHIDTLWKSAFWELCQRWQKMISAEKLFWDKSITKIMGPLKKLAPYF